MKMEKLFTKDYFRLVKGRKANIPRKLMTIDGREVEVTKIGQNMFRNMILSTVTIPNTVTTICSGAFDLASLTSITIPNSVTSIEHSAFYGCHKLTSITIPKSVETIGKDVFRYSGIKEIYVYRDYDTTSWGINSNELKIIKL